LFNGFSDFSHESGIERQVVEGCDSASERFSGFEQVSDVCGGIATGEGEDALVVEGAVEFCPFFAEGVDSSVECVNAVVSCHAGGEYAVEHIDSGSNRVEDVFGVTDSHEVPGFVGGEEGGGVSDHWVLHFGGFADADAADSNSIEGEFGDGSGAFGSEVLVDSTLDDSEDCLAFFPCGEVAVRPSVGALHGGGGLISGAGVRRTLVEHHGNVDSELGLDLDATFWCEEVGGAIEVGFELDAIVVDGAHVAEGHDLEASGVGEDGSFPVHEVMESTEFFDEVCAGPEGEVVGVAENLFEADGF
jgi:hypothetical protein